MQTVKYSPAWLAVMAFIARAVRCYFLAITPIRKKCNLLNHRSLFLRLHSDPSSANNEHFDTYRVCARLNLKNLVFFSLSGWLWRRGIKWLIIFFTFPSSGGPGHHTLSTHLLARRSTLVESEMLKTKQLLRWVGFVFSSIACYADRPSHYANVEINI